MKQMGNSRCSVGALILLANPFYLNDFANIYVKDWRWWLFIDYAGVKLLPLGVALWLIRSRRMRAAEFGLTIPTIPSFLATFLVVALVGTVIDQNAYQLVAKFSGYKALGGMPAIASPFWNWFDLTGGLVLVGICEELIFRGYLHTVISRYTQHPWAIVGISSIVFGFIHWSLGLHAILITSVIGAAIMCAHFLINFIDFAEIIPKSMFKFF
jgi:membrane protease YdiL (CAAX protease family)